MNRQQQFSNWLTYSKRKKNGGSLVQSTVTCYVRTITNISDDMIKLGVIDKNLYNITSASELDNYAKAIMSNSSFLTKNQRGHNRHVSALEHYIEFAHSCQ